MAEWMLSEANSKVTQQGQIVPDLKAQADHLMTIWIAVTLWFNVLHREQKSPQQKVLGVASLKEI